MVLRIHENDASATLQRRANSYGYFLPKGLQVAAARFNPRTGALRSTLAGALIWRVASAKMAVRWLFHPIYNMAEFVNLSKLNVDGALA
jgi:hypothetical protein